MNERLTGRRLAGLLYAMETKKVGNEVLSSASSNSLTGSIKCSKNVKLSNEWQNKGKLRFTADTRDNSDIVEVH